MLYSLFRFWVLGQRFSILRYESFSLRQPRDRHAVRKPCPAKLTLVFPTKLDPTKNLEVPKFSFDAT